MVLQKHVVETGRSSLRVPMNQLDWKATMHMYCEARDGVPPATSSVTNPLWPSSCLPHRKFWFRPSLSIAIEQCVRSLF